MQDSKENMICLEHVTKEYPNGTVAVRDLTMNIAAGEICAFVGPSGCGKTTTMRMINRLEDPTAGEIRVDGRNIATVDPRELRRHIGYVIQAVGLFPHYTIRKNVATVCHLLGWDKGKTDARVNELLDLVGLDPDKYGSRYPAQLSGGQRQRVGVARALAGDPPVLLMDEPFGAVDPLARDNLQQQFLDLQSRVHKTIVIVTHDIDEAVRMADRIAVFEQGGILTQYATPTDLLAHPANDFVQEFLGSSRTIKRLQLAGLPEGEVFAGDATGIPVIDEDASLQDALTVLLNSPHGRAVIGSSPGRILTLESIRQHLQAS